MFLFSPKRHEPCSIGQSSCDAGTGTGTGTGTDTDTDTDTENKDGRENDKDPNEEFLQYTLDISTHFKLPVACLDNKKILQPDIVTDLELIDTIDDTCEPIYNQTFSPVTEAGSIILRDIPKNYTSDTAYLKDTQALLRTYSIESEKDHDIVSDTIRIWKEIKGDLGFKSKYHYIEWGYWEKYNYSESVLQFISMYSLASPFLSLLVPVIIVIIPLFILKARGIQVTTEEYLQVLKVVAANHALCRLFTNFGSVSADQKLYLLFSTGLYLFSIYQNFLTCLRFYNNMKKIHTELIRVRTYIDTTMNEMDKFLDCSTELVGYTRFNESVRENRDKLARFKKTLDHLNSEQLSYKNLGQIGKLMKHFYEMYANDDINSMFLYSFGFHGFIENMSGLISHIRDKKIGFSTFHTKKKTVFKKSYYGSHINVTKTTNDVKLDKSMIITGPNASGKTTTLKTTLINILITQQFGCGYYKSANLRPFDHVHCYLNIPDTSGRDSLFQAEARRCKEILDFIQKNKRDRHFCVFDELYSGTNPDEAIVSAAAFMKYLLQNKHVKCILTTHYVSVCKQLDDHKEIDNYKMDTKEHDSGFEYTYSLKPGISEIRGGLKILSDMNYPAEILDSSRKNTNRV